MCILNKENLSGFINADSNSKYILMQTKGGKIFSVERNSLLTWIGRHITWLTGRSYQLPTIVDTIKNSLTQIKEVDDPEAIQEILEKINIRIEHYNLKHKNKIDVSQESTKSIGIEIEETEPKGIELTEKFEEAEIEETEPARIELTEKFEEAEIEETEPEGIELTEKFEEAEIEETEPARIEPAEEPELTYFEKQEALARKLYKERPKEDWGLQVQLDSTSGNIYATPREVVSVRDSLIRLHMPGSDCFKNLKFDPNLQNVFIRYQLAIICDKLFFTMFLHIGADRLCNVSTFGKAMAISSATFAGVLFEPAFSNLELSVQEKEVLMQATKFLAHAANVDGEHSEECQDECALPMASLDALDSVIEKISSFIADNKIEYDNDFSDFVDQINSIKRSIGSRFIKRANRNE